MDLFFEDFSNSLFLPLTDLEKGLLVKVLFSPDSSKISKIQTNSLLEKFLGRSLCSFLKVFEESAKNIEGVFMLSFVYHPKILVVGDADLERFCTNFGIIKPFVIKIDIENYFIWELEKLAEDIIEKAKTEGVDFILLATEDGDVVCDVMGILNEKSVYKGFLYDKEKGG